MEYADYYAVLGVPRTGDQAAIKTAYRKLAHQLHPDVNKDPAAHERFTKVNEAYEVLKDPEKRAKYDRLGANWEQLERGGFSPRHASSAAGGTDFSDFFETFFGSGGFDLDEALQGGGRTTFRFNQFGPGGTTRGTRPAPPRRGSDAEHEIEVGLEEAAHGAVRLFDIGGRTVEVRIPAGVADGSRVRVAGEGGPGSSGGGSGDLYLRVRLRPHLRFQVRGRDLIADLPVGDHVAVLGGEVEVAGLSGSLSVTVPPRTRDGRTMRLRGRGLPGLAGGSPGDLLLTVRITVPASPSPEELEHYRALAALRGLVPGEPAETTRGASAPA